MKKVLAFVIAGGKGERLHPLTKVTDFAQIGKDAKIKKTIIDRFNIIEDKTRIGYDIDKDKSRFFIDKESGLIIMPRGGRERP
ncbi:hypothetical protein ACFL0T_04395 [Candidatus Omnitrophota bacterium]